MKGRKLLEYGVAAFLFGLFALEDNGLKNSKILFNSLEHSATRDLKRGNQSGVADQIHLGTPDLKEEGEYKKTRRCFIKMFARLIDFRSYPRKRCVGKLLIYVVLILSFSACKGQAAPDGSISPPLNAKVGTAQNSYADVVNQVAPAVVTVRSERRVRAAEQFPFMNDPFFRDFFGDRFRNEQPRNQERLKRGLGSGVIVSPDGYIVTNHHVIDGAEDIRVELNDNRSFPAKVIGSDPPSDLAVLKIETQGLPVLPLGDSDCVRVGDVVLAVGNPLGVGQTVTLGIISAKGRQTDRTI